MTYVTLSESFEENAKRHEANATRHVANGHPDYAIGSLRKAAKWRAKKALFQVPPYLAEVYAIAKRNMDRMLFESLM